MMPVAEASPVNAKFLGNISDDPFSDWQAVAWEAVMVLSCMAALGMVHVLRGRRAQKPPLMEKAPRPAAPEAPPRHPKPFALHDPAKLAQQIASCTDRARVLDAYPRCRRCVNWAACGPEEAVTIFSHFCHAAGASKRMDVLEMVLADMRKLSVPRTPELYTSLLKIFAVRALYKDALTLSRWMQEDGIEVQSAAWSCLVFAAKAEKEYVEAARFFEELRAVDKPSANDYDNAISALACARDVRRAVKLIREMRKTMDEEPDIKTYNEVFAACCAGGKNIDLAQQLLELMKTSKRECAVDVITYNTLIKGYVQAGRLSEALSHLTSMQALGFTPTAVTFGTLMDACIVEGQLEKAREIFQQVLSSGCEMNTVLYTTLIKGFVKQGRVDEGLRVYDVMLKQNVQPDRVTYSTLLKALCDSNNLKRALELFDEMNSRGHEPDEVIFNNLIAGCVICKNMPLGEKLIKDMLASSIRLTPPTMSHLLKLYVECQEHERAFELFQNMETLYGVVADQRLYMQLVFVCLRVRRCSQALGRFREMLAKFGLPKHSDLLKVLQSCTTFNLHDAAVAMLASVLEMEGGRSLVKADMLQGIADKVRRKRSPKGEETAQAAVDLGRRYGLQVA